MRSKFAALLVIGLVALTACTTTTRRQGPSEIRIAGVEDRYVDVARHKAFHEGKMIGWVDDKRLIDGDSNDANDRYQRFVLDPDGDMLGFITDKGEAYQLRAHGQPELVGVHNEVARAARVVFGITSGEVTLEKQVLQD